MGSKPPNFAFDIRFGTTSCDASLLSIAIENDDVVASVDFNAAYDCGWLDETLVAGSAGSFSTIYEFPKIPVEYMPVGGGTAKMFIGASCSCPVKTIPDSVKYCQGIVFP